MAKRTNVDFGVVNNPMLKFLLEDGTEIDVQMVMMRIVRTDEKLPDGQFRHEFQMQQCINQVAPAGEIDVKKLAGGTK